MSEDLQHAGQSPTGSLQQFTTSQQLYSRTDQNIGEVLDFNCLNFKKFT